MAPTTLADERPSLSAGIRTFLPILGWLPAYRTAWLRSDTIAGLTLWGMLIPEGIAYAAMAGAPHEAGLYTLLASLTFYAVLGTSRQLACAATSSSSIMMAAVVAPLAATNPEKSAALLVLLVLLVAVIFVVSGVIRLGFVASFVSEPVMTGFVFGMAIYIAVSQVPKLVGLEKAAGDTVAQAWHVLAHIEDWNWIALAIGISSLALMVFAERRYPQVPSALMCLVLGIVAVSLFGLARNFDVKIVGNIPGGLPAIGLPGVNFHDVAALLPGALGVTLVTFSQALGTAQTFAARHGYDVDINQELIAMGVSNLGSGLLGGLVNGGSMSSTAVNDRAGAKTQISSLVAVGMVIVTLMIFTPLFHNLPEALLGAIVIHAVVRLMRFSEMKRFYRWQRGEFWLAMVALVGVIVLNLLSGLLIAVTLSLVRVIWRASRLSVSVLGRIPGREDAYGSIEQNPENEPIPGLVILRLDSPLFFANAAQFGDKIRALLRGNECAHAILLALRANPNLDVSSADMLLSLVTEAREADVEIMFCELSDPVVEMFKRSGLMERMEQRRIFTTVHGGVLCFLEKSAHSGA